MPQFNLNGTAVELVPQDRPVFSWLATQVYRKLFVEGTPPLPGVLAMLALDAPRQNVTLDDPRAQAVMWTLYQMGFDKVEMDEAANQVKWIKGTQPDIGTRPLIEHFSEEGMKDGRALAAGLNVVQQRNIRVNGIEMAVRTVDFELLKAQAEEMKKRHTDTNTDMALAAARYVAELLASGATDTDLRLRAALELAADLGVRSLVLDPANRQVRIESFNEMAALAAAYFQNLPADQLPLAVKRIQALNSAAAENNRRAGEQQPAQARKGAQPVAAAAGQQQQQAQAINLTFKRRRR